MQFLPIEIWQLVFSNFVVNLVPETWHDGIGPDPATRAQSYLGREAYTSQENSQCLSTLASLSRVCHVFRDLAEPLLYRSIHQENVESGPRGWHTSLCRTLTGTHDAAIGCKSVERGGLGGYVRAISLGARVFEHFLDMDETLEAALPSLRLPYICREHVVSGGGDFAEDHGSRLFMASLACTPRVEFLECRIRESRQLFAAFIAGATSSPDVRALIQEEREGADYTVRSEPWKYRNVPPATKNGDYEFSLQHLKALRLRHDHDTGPAKVTDIEPVLYHPSLQTLQLSGWDWTNRESHTMLCWRNNDDLETLELDDCVTDEQAIGDILERFKNLKTLVIRLVRDSWGRSDIPWWEVWLPELTHKLVTAGQNLVRLDLDTDECCGSVIGRLGSLREMRSLRHLKVAYRDLLSPRDPDIDTDVPDVPLESLVLAELLPANLETLCVYKSAFDERARNHYRHLLVASRKSQVLQNLRSLTVQCRSDEGEQMEDPLLFDQEVHGWRHSSMEERRMNKFKGKGPARSWKYRVSTRSRAA